MPKYPGLKQSAVWICFKIVQLRKGDMGMYADKTRLICIDNYGSSMMATWLIFLFSVCLACLKFSKIKK